jgi:hypothetical protein
VSTTDGDVVNVVVKRTYVYMVLYKTFARFVLRSMQNATCSLTSHNAQSQLIMTAAS